MVFQMAVMIWLIQIMMESQTQQMFATTMTIPSISIQTESLMDVIFS